jgi:dTDP-4-dehydrorhamnose reductase
MKIIITGAGGQLGKALVKLFSSCDYKVFSFTKRELDITSKEQIKEVFNKISPDIIINCAAFTKVDLCETDVEKAYLINGLAPFYLGTEANKHQAKLIHISTDYVFSGNQTSPYKETDQPNPQTIYGKSKLLGEELLLKNCNNLLIVRTSWLYGNDANNFVHTMMKLSEKLNSIKVVHDQFGSPTYTRDVALAIQSLMKDKTGIYHVTNSGKCSWYEFAKEIMRLIHSKTEILPISSQDYQFNTPRPSYSVLDNHKLEKEGIRLRDWKSALSTFFREEYDQNED